MLGLVRSYRSIRPAGPNGETGAGEGKRSLPLLDLYLAVLERSGQGFGIALLNRPGKRVLFRGIFNPAQHRGAGGQPFPAHLAAGQFSFLKEIIDGIRRDGQQLGRHVYIEYFGDLGDRGAEHQFSGLSGRHGSPHVRSNSG
jgi:hypothetical protein